MHSFWLFFLRKREFTILVILALVGIGIYTVFAIKKENFPEIIVPIGIVQTVYLGAPANDIEELITNKLENAIENVENLDKVTSVSRDDVSIITAEFNASADIDKSIQDLKDAIDTAKSELPRDANDPFVGEVNFSNQPIQIISISSDLSPVAFTELGEKLKTEFKKVKGVSDVQVSGTRVRQIQVTVTPESLATYGLDVSDVTTALASGNVTLPVGVVVNGGIEYSVRLEGKLSDADSIKNLPLPSKSGVPLYVRDVATVTDSVDKAKSIARVSVAGAPSELALTLSIFKKSSADVTVTSAGIDTQLASLRLPGDLLSGSQVSVVFDQGAETRKSLQELVRAGIETVVLVVVVLLLTIGWRESLVAALSIPLSFVIAFIGLYASGNTINFISLFALILAIGILVDSGIVITEAIHTRTRKFGDPSTAAVEAIKEYAWPLIGGTLTTVAVFAPLFFLSGITGEFISSIPFTIIFVLIASIFVALGMVPLLAIYLTGKSKPSAFEEKQEQYTHTAQSWYRTKLVTFLQNKWAQRGFLWSLFAGLIVAILLPVFGLMNVEFFPPEDVDFVYVEIEAAQGTPLRQTDLVVRAVEEILYEKDYIKSFVATVGSGSSFTGGENSGGKFGNITIALNAERTQTSAEISADLRAAFATVSGVTIKITEQQNGPPTGAPIALKFTGTNLSTMGQVVERAEAILQNISGTRDIEASTKSNATEFVLTVDRAKAALAGVNPGAVGGLLRATVFGSTATTLTRNGDDIDVLVKVGEPDQTIDLSSTPEVSLDTLRNLQIKTQKGETILLGSILTDKLEAANAAINHEEKKRVISVSAYVDETTTAADVLATFKTKTSELEMPDDVAIIYAGESEDVNSSFAEMGIALLVGLLLMLAILVLSFNSVRYSLYLLLAVPYSLIGVFTGLTLTGLALSFTSLLGVIALAGVIINHAIILMDSLITHKASTASNETLLEQVASASVSRFRPILLTTITTVVGMIPLSMISGFWSPLAFAIMFGLSFAMILTLLLVPVLYYRNEQHKLDKAAGKFKDQTWGQYFYSYLPWSKLD